MAIAPSIFDLADMFAQPCTDADLVQRLTLGGRPLGHCVDRRTEPTLQLVRAFRDRMHEYFFHPRVLNLAHQQLKAAERHYPRAPGPDWELLDLPPDIAKQLSKGLRTGTYRPRPGRLAPCPKPMGGTRPIRVQKARDKVVFKAFQMVFDPLLDAQLSPQVLCRTNHGRFDGLFWLRVDFRSSGGQKAWFLGGDCNKAYNSVDMSLLREAVTPRIPNPKAVDLLMDLVKTSGLSNGLAQGNCCSSLLLNTYLDHYFIRRLPRSLRPWLYADDYGLLVESRKAGQAAEAIIKKNLARIGARLKPEKRVLVDLREEAAEWLGYSMKIEGFDLAFHLSRAWRDKLWGTLQKMEADFPGLRRQDRKAFFEKVRRVAGGWVRSQGAAVDDLKDEDTLERISTVANNFAGEKAYSTGTARRDAEQGIAAWQWTCAQLLEAKEEAELWAGLDDD